MHTYFFQLATRGKNQYWYKQMQNFKLISNMLMPALENASKKEMSKKP
jgi:hypothetical protein